MPNVTKLVMIIMAKIAKQNMTIHHDNRNINFYFRSKVKNYRFDIKSQNYEILNNNYDIKT